MEKLKKLTQDILNNLHEESQNFNIDRFRVRELPNSPKLIALYLIWINLFKDKDIIFTNNDLLIGEKSYKDMELEEDKVIITISKLILYFYKEKSEHGLNIFILGLYILNNIPYNVSKKYYFTQKCKIIKKGVLCL